MPSIGNSAAIRVLRWCCDHGHGDARFRCESLCLRGLGRREYQPVFAAMQSLHRSP